jgi:hypothetical protein
MVQWKDTTSYSYTDKERIPRIWEATIGSIRLSVHRYVGLDGWYLSTNPDICTTRGLHSKTHEEAKQEAIRLMIIWAREQTSELEKAKRS